MVIMEIGLAALSFSFYEESRSNKRFKQCRADVSEEDRRHIAFFARLIDHAYGVNANFLKVWKGTKDCEQIDLFKDCKQIECPEIEEEGKKLGIVSCTKDGMLVIAARGTTSSYRDAKDDALIFLGAQHTSNRYEKVKCYVRRVMKHVNDSKLEVWLVGHSLGADVMRKVAIALAGEGIEVCLCCFNLPTCFTFSNKWAQLSGIRTLEKRLWHLKGFMERVPGVHKFTSAIVRGKDKVKCWSSRAISRDGYEFDRQLHLSNTTKPGVVLLCLNKSDPFCYGVFDHYRRNDKTGRTILRANLTAIFMAWLLGDHGEPDHFPLPKQAIVFCSEHPGIIEGHGLDQWSSKDTKMWKVGFDLTAP